MKIMIEGPVRVDRMSNRLVIEGSYIHGDDDGDSVGTHGFDYLPGDPVPEDFVTIIKGCRLLKETDDYEITNEWDGLVKFLTEHLGEDGFQVFQANFTPSDMFSDGDSPAYLEKFEVFWYDKNGTKNDVKIID
jgi:hypothetical protein